MHYERELSGGQCRLRELTNLLGLQYNANIPTRSYTSGSLTYDDVLNAEAAILGANVAVQHVRTHTLVNGEQITSENNALRERLSLDWVCSPSFKRLAKQTSQLGTNTSLPIWETGDEGEDDVVTIYGQGLPKVPKILGYNAHISPFVSQARRILGTGKSTLSAALDQSNCW